MHDYAPCMHDFDTVYPSDYKDFTRLKPSSICNNIRVIIDMSTCRDRK